MPEESHQEGETPNLRYMWKKVSTPFFKDQNDGERETNGRRTNKDDVTIQNQSSMPEQHKIKQTSNMIKRTTSIYSGAKIGKLLLAMKVSRIHL